MGVSGVKWCDFIVYTNKVVYVERIAFDPVFWQNLRTELGDYFNYFLKFAATDFQQED